MENQIHPTAIISPSAILGKGNYIGPYCIIYDGVVIGDYNRLESNVVIGSNAEHRDYFIKGSNFSVEIGNNNIFREFTTINAGTSRNTQINNNITMLRSSHIGHDVIVEDGVTLSCNVLIGGESYIMKGVNMGLGAICHQYSVIGAFSIVGMGGIVTKKSKIVPGKKYVGNPVRDIGLNEVGLERNNISSEDLDLLNENYDKLIKSIK